MKGLWYFAGRWGTCHSERSEESRFWGTRPFAALRVTVPWGDARIYPAKSKRARMNQQPTSNPDTLLERAEDLLQAGERQKAALSARQVIEKYDFRDERAWRFLHTLVGSGQSLEEFQQKIARKYYPDRAHLLTATLAESSVFTEPESKPTPQTPNVSSGAKTLGKLSVVCGMIGLIAFGIPLGILAILMGIPALAMNADSGKTGIILGVVDIVLAALIFSSL